MWKPQSHGLILLVDDDPRNGRVLAQMLREDGFEVELSDQREAIPRLSRTPAPDVLLTDLRAPTPAAMAVAHFGRARRPGLPVLVVTGHAERLGLLERDLEPPPKVLPKPLSYDALREELWQIVGDATPA